MLSIAPSTRISPLADIEDSKRGTRIIIEDGVVIDAFVKLKPAGGSGDVVIGSGTVINSGWCTLYRQRHPDRAQCADRSQLHARSNQSRLRRS